MADAAILLVDDNLPFLTALEAALDSLGCRIVLAKSGEEALSLVLAGDFSVVIMDLMLPRMNGFEVCALMRAGDRDLPVIILSGYDEASASALPGYRRGAYEFMRKPVPPETLRAKVAGCVARRSV